MTESSDHSSSPEDEDVSRPVASLAEVRVRRRRARMLEPEPEQSKPGDLTSILEKRSRDAEPNSTDDAPPADEIDPSESIEASLFQIDQPAEAGPGAGADIPPATEPPPSGDGGPAGPTAIQADPIAEEALPPVLAADEVDSLRLTREQAREIAGLEGDPPATGENDAKESPAPPAAISIRRTAALPPEEEAEIPQPEPTTEMKEATPAATGPSIRRKAALPPEETEEDPPAGTVSESMEGENESPAPEPSIRRKSRESGKKEDKARPSKKNEKEADVLRKRMAAVVKSGSKRREQAAARKSNWDPPAAPAPPLAPQRQAAARPNDIFRYWTLHRNGRAMPALSALNLDEVAKNWPDSLLLRFAAGSRHLELEMSFSKNAMARGHQPNTQERRIDYTPAVVEWVLSQGLTAAKDGTPARVMAEFETETEVRRYSMVALPLSEDGANVDHILCHLQPD